jgi:hypothetical protein
MRAGPGVLIRRINEDTGGQCDGWENLPIYKPKNRGSYQKVGEMNGADSSSNPQQETKPVAS